MPIFMTRAQLAGCKCEEEWELDVNEYLKGKRCMHAVHAAILFRFFSNLALFAAIVFSTMLVWFQCHCFFKQKLVETSEFTDATIGLVFFAVVMTLIRLRY